ncbi:MAG: ATP-binding protein [Saprospiraceae bacterium]|nr:ATP-binding protein [Saprospiraceae bacterium]
MISRQITPAISELLRYYPIVSLSGPRQSGKTTLLRWQFPDLPYVSLEDPDERRFALSDPRRFLDSYPKGAILDEVQQVPELFSYLQTRVDTDKNLRFLLSGSQNFLLMEKVTQSLAGRVGLLNLLPLSWSEMPVADLHAWMWKGGFPAIYDREMPPRLFFPNYLQTYLERDVRLLKSVGNLLDFERFMRLCAGRAGQLLNLSALAMDAGVSVNTAKAWLAVLEASFAVFLVAPYHDNFNKRLIKMPKLYFYDTGLLAYLLNIEQAEQIGTHFAVGHIFENLVIAELAKQWMHAGERPQFYFFRDSNGNEVDLLAVSGGKIFALEIKYGKTLNADFFKGLRYWSTLSGNPSAQCFLISGGDTPSVRAEGTVVPWHQLAGFRQRIA